MNRKLNKHLFWRLRGKREKALYARRENNGSSKAAGRQGTSLILGGVNKPNGQQERSWQEVMEPWWWKGTWKGSLVPDCRMTLTFSALTNTGHIWVVIPNTGPQVLIVRPTYHSSTQSTSRCKVVILGLISNPYMNKRYLIIYRWQASKLATIDSLRGHTKEFGFSL